MIKRKYKRISLGTIKNEVELSDSYELRKYYDHLMEGNTYNFRNFIKALEEDGFLYREERIEVKTTFLSRILLPIFFIVIVFFFIVGGSIKYVLKGSGKFDKEGMIYKFLTKWADWGGYQFM